MQTSSGQSMGWTCGHGSGDLLGWTDGSGHSDPVINNSQITYFVEYIFSCKNCNSVHSATRCLTVLTDLTLMFVLNKWFYTLINKFKAENF